jgi:hypothetical protein
VRSQPAHEVTGVVGQEVETACASCACRHGLNQAIGARLIWRYMQSQSEETTAASLVVRTVLSSHCVRLAT